MAGDARRDWCPPAARGRDRLERQPAPVPDLDRIATVPRREQGENPALEEGRVHAKLQRHAPAELAAQVVDHFPQERDGLLGIVDIARPVFQPEDVAGLRDVGQQRIVARVLPMVRVEPPEGPADGGPSPDHGAVHVDGDPGQVQAGQGLGHEITVERHEGRQGLLRELPEPVRHGAAGWQPGQAAEARDQRVAAQEAEMFQPAGPGIEQGEQHQGHSHAAVITGQTGERPTQARGQTDPSQIPAQQFQATVRRERLGTNWMARSPLTTRRKLAIVKRIRGASRVRGSAWGCFP